jgi:hypothetical protein
VPGLLVYKNKFKRLDLDLKWKNAFWINLRIESSSQRALVSSWWMY